MAGSSHCDRRRLGIEIDLEAFDQMGREVPVWSISSRRAITTWSTSTTPAATEADEGDLAI
jgi:hypothetical protein